MTEFALDRTEVTVEDFESCVAVSRCETRRYMDDWACNWRKKAEKRRHPMNCVTFEEAQRYCQWKEKRLPTGDEWEYAARTAAGDMFPWKTADMQLQSALELGYCWRSIGTCEVDRGAENDYGLRGMAGNVSEWTTRDPRVDGTFGEVLRGRNPAWRWKVAYGTSWKDPDLDIVEMLFLAAVVPYSDDHASVNPGIGFRCAL